MPTPQDHISMALFCDFENVALGVRDANYEKFDIKRVLERLLLKGSIVVKKAYCDWERYKGFKAQMHEANFELIEIPHVRQSGKNSADIRLVVDALDLCYTKAHVNTFVVISGDSDFSPLVSKLRENAKYVIGVGVKQSTSDLLIANCDEFIFYDDLVREGQRAARAVSNGKDAPSHRRSPEEEKHRREDAEAKRLKAVTLALETYDALVRDRDDGGRIWASMLKEAIKRRNPGFNESYYGYKTFGNLLEDAHGRGLLEFGRDDKSGAYVSRSPAAMAAGAAAAAAMAEGPDGRADATWSGVPAQAQADASLGASLNSGSPSTANASSGGTAGANSTGRSRRGRSRGRGESQPGHAQNGQSGQERPGSPAGAAVSPVTAPPVAAPAPSPAQMDEREAGAAPAAPAAKRGRNAAAGRARKAAPASQPSQTSATPAAPEDSASQPKRSPRAKTPDSAADAAPVARKRAPRRSASAKKAASQG